MLNANARDFVPGQTVIETGLFRYHLNVPSEKLTDISREVDLLNNVSSFVMSKRFYAMKDSRDDESLPYFIENFFRLLQSNEGNTSGFLLSRHILSLLDMNRVLSVNDSPGFLICMDFPSDTVEMLYVYFLRSWEVFFGHVNQNENITCFGYSRSVVGSKDKKVFRHYFFGCCDNDAVAELVTRELANILQTAYKVSSILPYLCGSISPLSVILTVGEEASNELKSYKADFLVNIRFSLSDIQLNFEEIDTFKNEIATILNGTCKWDRTYIAHVAISVIDSEAEGKKNPLWDMIFDIASVCDQTGSKVIGVSFSSRDCVPDSAMLLSANKDAPFFIKATAEKVLTRGQSLCTFYSEFGTIPQNVRKPIVDVTQRAASEAMAIYQGTLPQNMTLLNREVFPEAANFFAKEKIMVRRRAMGASVIIGTDCNGATFAIDTTTNSVFGFSNYFGGLSPKDIPKDCIFRGTIVSSFRGFIEYRAIIEDVLFFQGNDVRGLPFSERWEFVVSLGIDEEDMWPHSTPPDHFVILRAKYISTENMDPPNLDTLSALIGQSETTSLGLVFVPAFLSGNPTVYFWVPPVGISAVFSVSELFNVEDNPGLRKATLSVRDDTGLTPFKNEYVEFLAAAYPDLETGDLLECILRRDKNTHWWDAVRSFGADTRTVSLFEDVEKIVYSPVASGEDITWLLGASNYLCERCDEVKDSGRINELQGNSFWCVDCWKETGHGDCVYCQRTLVLGMFDKSSGFFYCKNCWDNFSKPNENAELGYHVPPPPDATFTQQVITRCVSLLVDLIGAKWATNDVLDLCCGGSVVRKWMKNGTARYLGVDKDPEAVAKTLEVIKNSHLKELSMDMKYNVICHDAFASDLMQKITEIHPRQFHVISCFAALHHAFVSEEKARVFIGSVANALVPGGVFTGFFIDANVAFSNGRSFSNSVFKTEWAEGAKPRFGHTFKMSVEDEPFRDINVVSFDFLIDVATNFNLNIVPEGCHTLLQFVEKDKNFTKVLNDDEKEYLCVLRSFTFKKSGEENNL